MNTDSPVSVITDALETLGVAQSNFAAADIMRHLWACGYTVVARVPSTPDIEECIDLPPDAGLKRRPVKVQLSTPDSKKT